MGDGDGTTHVYLTNRNLHGALDVRCAVGADVGEATVRLVSSDDPLDGRTAWSGETSYDTEVRSVPVVDGTGELTLPPAAVARVTVTT